MHVRHKQNHTGTKRRATEPADMLMDTNVSKVSDPRKASEILMYCNGQIDENEAILFYDFRWRSNIRGLCLIWV